MDDSEFRNYTGLPYESKKAMKQEAAEAEVKRFKEMHVFTPVEIKLRIAQEKYSTLKTDEKSSYVITS